MRIILFTGKGGVGKTTISAATALRTAELGYKTLVISTDPAHSLSDSLDTLLKDKPVKIKNNLYAQEIDTQKEMEENWGMVQEHVATLLEVRGMDNVVAEELAIIPGLEELFSLIEIKEHCDKKEYDILIVDSAPTGSSLRLLSFPEVLNWYVKNIFNIQKPQKKVYKSSRPDSSIVGMVENIYYRIDGLRDILLNQNQTTVRIVVNPEKMVIKEAQRGYTYLNLFGLAVDAVMVNKILPEELDDEYFEKWKETQKKHLQLIREYFEPLPIFEIKLFEQELVGEKLLSKFTKDIYGRQDPAKIFFEDKPVEFLKDDGGFLIKVKLPFVERKQLDLLQRGDELIIKVGAYKHSIVLPQALVGEVPREAKIKEDKLHIYFGEKKDEKKRK